MDNLEPILPSTSEILVAVVALALPAVVFVASFRRNRLLFNRSIVDSILIALVSAVFWPVWLVASIVARRQISAGWAQHGRTRDLDRATSAV